MIGLRVTQTSSATAPPETPYNPAAASQLKGIGPTEIPDSAAISTHCPIWSSTSLALSATMIPAVVQASTCPHQGVANSPMFRRFDVKWISGITANESCKLRITWLRISRPWVDWSPASAIATTAGTRASSRVISRRSQGAIRRCR